LETVPVRDQSDSRETGKGARQRGNPKQGARVGSRDCCQTHRLTKGKLRKGRYRPVRVITKPERENSELDPKEPKG